jgi:hypothetical protein
MTQPVIRPGNPNPFLAQMNPEAAVLTGTAKDAALDFHVDRINERIGGGAIPGSPCFSIAPRHDPNGGPLVRPILRRVFRFS